MGAFDIDNVDETIHGRLRLGIMSVLSSSETATFNELTKRLKASKGNMSVQLRKLEDAGYISITRRVIGKKTELRARLSKTGRTAFAAYLQQLRHLIEDSGV